MTFQTLGDSHLGKAFKTGVPLHRLGEREALIWAEFEVSLMSVTADFHIHMGDLFDKFVVPPEVTLVAADIYIRAAKTHPNTIYIVLMGNHDPSKDATKRSSFDIFEALTASVPNILVLRKPTLIADMGFLPYSVFGTAKDSLATLLEQGTPSMVFGHWDVVDWGGDNVIPTSELAAAGIELAFTGHDHLMRVEKRHGVKINVVGSMQPYTHAEDAEGSWYRTVTLEELGQIDPTNLNIRVLLQQDEVLPEGINCLSLTAKKVGSEVEETTVDTEEFDSFDLTGELTKLLPDSIRDEVMEVFLK